MEELAHVAEHDQMPETQQQSPQFTDAEPEVDFEPWEEHVRKKVGVKAPRSHFRDGYRAGQKGIKKPRKKQISRKEALSLLEKKKSHKKHNKKNQHDQFFVSERKPRRYRPGTVALREIRRHQKNTDLLIKKAPFRRLVRETAQKETTGKGVRFQADALEALQVGAEGFMIDQFKGAQVLAIGNQRQGIDVKDLQMLRQNDLVDAMRYHTHTAGI